MNFSRLIVSCVFLLSASRLVLAHDVVAKGVVYNDFNANGIRDSGEEGVADVRVSNGDDIVLTNKDGKYELLAETQCATINGAPSEFNR